MLNSLMAEYKCLENQMNEAGDCASRQLRERFESLSEKIFQATGKYPDPEKENVRQMFNNYPHLSQPMHSIDAWLIQKTLK